MLLVPNVQNPGVPIDVREFEEEHLLTSKAGIHGETNKFWPIVEMIWMRAPIFFGFGDQLFDLRLREVIRANRAVVAEQVHVPGETSM